MKHTWRYGNSGLGSAHGALGAAPAGRNQETVKSQRESKNYVQFIKHINLI